MNSYTNYYLMWLLVTPGTHIGHTLPQKLDCPNLETCQAWARGFNKLAVPGTDLMFQVSEVYSETITIRPVK